MNDSPADTRRAASAKAACVIRVDHAARGAMRFELLRRPGRLELLDEVRRADHFASLRANQLDRACVHQRDVRNRFFRRILHGYFFRAADQLLQIFFQLLRRGVEHFVAGQRIERCGFDPVHEFRGAPFRRNHVEPAALGQGMVESQYAVGNRIAVKDVVEEPSVDLLLAGERTWMASMFGMTETIELAGAASCRVISFRDSPRTCAAVAPREFPRASCGCARRDAILTAVNGTFKRDASSLRSASFARSSTGGAVRRIFNPSCTRPRFRRGSLAAAREPQN